MATLAMPRDPSARPFCSSKLGAQFVSNRDVRSISASLSFDNSWRWRSIKALICSSVEIVKDILIEVGAVVPTPSGVKHIRDCYD